MEKEKSKRVFEVLAGVCFLVSTVSYSVGSGMVEKALAIFEEKTGKLPEGLGIGISLELVNSLAVIAIGLFLFWVLKKVHQGFAGGYLVARIVEGVLLGIGSFAAFLGVNDPLHTHSVLFNVAMLVLGIYSVVFFLAVLKWKVGPAWLFWVGEIGYVLLIAYALVNLLGMMNGAPMWLFGPGAVFEIIFPIWLIIRGFKLKKEA